MCSGVEAPTRCIIYPTCAYAKVRGSQWIRYPTTHSWVQQPFCPRDPWSQTMNQPGVRHKWPSVSPSPFSGKDGSHIFESNSQQPSLGGQANAYSYWSYIIALSFCYVVVPSKSQFTPNFGAPIWRCWYISPTFESTAEKVYILTLLVPSLTIWGGGVLFQYNWHLSINHLMLLL